VRPTSLETQHVKRKIIPNLDLLNFEELETTMSPCSSGVPDLEDIDALTRDVDDDDDLELSDTEDVPERNSNVASTLSCNE